MDLDEDNQDEEINIDFSKIKNLFKRKKKDSEKTKQETSKEPEIIPQNEQPQEKVEEIKTEEPKVETEVKQESHKSEISEELETKSHQVEEKKETSKEDEENEEINIDFSKIKNIFKKKTESQSTQKEETKSNKESDEEKEDEEISLDFGKIKGFFKGLKKGVKEKPEEGDEEEIFLDVKKTMDFFGKHQKIIIPTLLIIIAIFFSVYIRIQPAYLPATDDWARNAAYNQIQSSIKTQIDQQYPNLPEANKNSLVDAEFQKLLKEQKTQINQQIEATSNYFKTRLQNENGQTYLLAIDPYFWMRHAQNVLDNGHPGDELIDGKPYDNHMYAPIGRPVPPDMFHAYFEAYFYKFMRFFNRDLDLMTLVFYIPIILSALCIFPAFFIGKRLSGNFGGFISAFIIAVHPSFVTRTAGGFADTDAYNVLFPLLITWLFLEAFETENKKKMITYSGLAGLLVALFSLSWGGWFYIFDFIIAASVAYLIFFLILNRNELKNIKQFIKKPAFYNPLTSIGIFIASSAIFTSIFTSFNNFMNAFLQGPLAFARLKQVAITSIWPNVYTTVAEQNPASLNSVISQIGVGSVLLFLIGLTGIALTMLKKETKKSSDLWFVIGSIIWFILILGIRPQNLTVFLGLISLPIIIKLILIIKNKDNDVDIKAAILLILWFSSTIYASVKGVRFTLLAVPAFAIALGVSLGIGYYYLHKLITKGLKINKNISKALVIIMLCLLLLGPYRSSKSTATNEIPSMNDAWYNSLQKIDLEAEPDAIINSWWDFGHWFKMIGDRAVTFDGTSQNSPNAHWIGSTLLTKDEDYAVGVLRMVDCGQNKAFEELDKIINDGAKSINILEEVVRLNKKEANSELLNNDLSEEQANKVLEFTHCTPPENYFITSYDMIGKAGVWAHFGSWNFDRSLIYNTLKKKEYKDDLEKSISFLQDRFNYTRTEAENIYYDVQSIQSDTEANSWIAPWPSYAGSSGCITIEENKIACDIGQGAQAEIDLTTLQADIQTQQGVMHPDSVVLPLEDGSYRKKEFNNTIGLSMVLVPVGEGNYGTLMMHPLLDKSMFTTMFYLNGHGLKYFEKFSDTTDITGGRIIVWKVNWQGNSTNLFEYYQPKPIPEESQETPITETNEEAIEENTQSTNDSQDINTLNNSEE
jgi:dolichyl-phosphooligosaccharide-protein glycotransferase